MFAMSVSSVDAGLGFPLYINGFYAGSIVIVVISLGLYLFVVKSCFGTFSLKEANAIYRKTGIVRKKYESLFATRDNLMYHISWSKSQGEIDDARRLMRQLAEVDKVQLLRNYLSSWYT